jgi:hypothetical protein
VPGARALRDADAEQRCTLTHFLFSGGSGERSMPPSTLPEWAAAAAPPLLHAYWVLATGAVASLAAPDWVVPPRFKCVFLAR